MKNKTGAIIIDNTTVATFTHSQITDTKDLIRENCIDAISEETGLYVEAFKNWETISAKGFDFTDPDTNQTFSITIAEKI